MVVEISWIDQRQSSQTFMQQQEEFYTCTWSMLDGTQEPVVAAAGKLGIVRLLLFDRFLNHKITRDSLPTALLSKTTCW